MQNFAAAIKEVVNFIYTARIFVREIISFADPFSQLNISN